VRAAAAAAGLHAKLTGAGGGGCAFVLLRPDMAAAAADELRAALADQGCDTFEVVVGAEGVTLQ
jgi:mevalonate kinase